MTEWDVPDGLKRLGLEYYWYVAELHGEAIAIIWGIYYPELMREVLQLIRNCAGLKLIQINEAETETLRAICELPLVHETQAKDWIRDQDMPDNYLPVNVFGMRILE